MMITKTSVGLSMSALIALILACQPDVIQDNRRATVSETAQPATSDGNAKPVDDKKTTPPTGTTPSTGTPAATPLNFTMTWDVSADPAVTAYKIFIVPPDRNPRFPGKTDVPVQIKNYPIAGLQKVGEKYSVVVTSDEVKTALGAAIPAPATYCFTIVSVNGVGNSAHSPVICP